MSQSGYFVTVELKAKPGQTPAAVHAALQQLAAASEREAGCSLFAVRQDADDPQRFVLWEAFHSEAAFKQHGAEPHSQQFAALGLIEPVRVSKSRALDT
jgi:quinol monooxygenase YgiN